MKHFFNQPLINPNLDVESLKNEFNNNRVVVIKNFLNPIIAEKLHKWFTEEMPKDWWRISSYPKMDGEDGFDLLPFDDKFLPQIQEMYTHSINSFKDDKFSYNFHRTVNDHQDTCNCYECGFRDALISDEILNFLNGITNQGLTSTDEVFGAVYLPGDFLAPHQDSPNGTLGFTLQLSKNWKPQFGGNLHFMDGPNGDIERVVVPTFNTLTIFDLPKGIGKWHYVSTVSPGVEELRLTYAGWFK
jgi:Rps23 Pro-64 3,4-dihydroxylase Tpa1-like proline 4-hydroxylase